MIFLFFFIQALMNSKKNSIQGGLRVFHCSTMSCRFPVWSESQPLNLRSFSSSTGQKMVGKSPPKEKTSSQNVALTAYEVQKWTSCFKLSYLKNIHSAFWINLVGEVAVIVLFVIFSSSYGAFPALSGAGKAAVFIKCELHTSGECSRFLSGKYLINVRTLPALYLSEPNQSVLVSLFPGFPPRLLRDTVCSVCQQTGCLQTQLLMIDLFFLITRLSAFGSLNVTPKSQRLNSVGW